MKGVKTTGDAILEAVMLPAPKPHIKRVPFGATKWRQWLCSDGLVAASGETPHEAYECWVRNANLAFFLNWKASS